MWGGSQRILPFFFRGCIPHCLAVFLAPILPKKSSLDTLKIDVPSYSHPSKTNSSA
jgi:hypothetical protein